MNRLLAFAALGLMSIPPLVAVYACLRVLGGDEESWPKTGVACAAATSLLWSFMAGGAVILGWPQSVLAVPAVFCLVAGGICAWKQSGWSRWTQLAGVLFFAVAPLLLMATHTGNVAALMKSQQARRAAGPR